MRLRQTSALSNFDVDELPHLTILFGPADVLRLSVSTCPGGDDDERLTEAHGHARRGAPIRVSRLMISPPGRRTTHPSQNGSFVLLAMILVSRSPNSRDCAVTRLNPQPISSHLILCFSPSPVGIHAAQALYGLSVGPCTGITSATDRPTDSVMRCDAMRCAVALLLDAVLRRGRIAVCWGRAEKSGPSQRADRTCPDVRRRAQCCTMVQYSAYSIAGEESVITKHVRCTSKVAPRIYRHDTYSTALRGAFPS